jgi:hypothetical protein
MPEEDLRLSTTRYMYTKLLPDSEIEEMSPLPDRLDWQRVCWRESSDCRTSKEEEEC